MKAIRLLASLAAVSAACSITGACSSDNGDDTPGPAAGSSGKGAGGSGAEPEAGNDAGGSSSERPGTAGESTRADAGAGPSSGGAATSGGGAGGDAGSGPSCDADVSHDPENCGRCQHSCGGGECAAGKCEPVVVLDPSPRSVTPNVSLDVRNRVLVSDGSLYYWSYGYLPNTDYAYTILKASTQPTTPPSDGTPTLETFAIDAAPIDGATFSEQALYYTIQTGAGAAEARRFALDGSDGAAAAAKVFSLDNGRIWRNIVLGGDAVYLTGEVDTNVVDQLKTGIYRLPWPPANAGAKPSALTGLTALDNAVMDLTLVGDHLFWTEQDDDTTHALLWTAPVAGGNPVMLDDVTQFGGASIAGDPSGDYVYWTSHHHGGHLARCALGALAAEQVEELDTVDNASEGLLVDDSYVYYQEDESLVSGKPIWRVPKAGGERELLGEIDGSSALVGLDDGFVYAQDFDGVLYKVSKIP